jgi:hypothetical protein
VQVHGHPPLDLPDRPGGKIRKVWRKVEVNRQEEAGTLGGSCGTYSPQ